MSKVAICDDDTFEVKKIEDFIRAYHLPDKPRRTRVGRFQCAGVNTLLSLCAAKSSAANWMPRSPP